MKVAKSVKRIAFELGCGSILEEKYKTEGRLLKAENHYEVRTLETLDEKGEIAKTGDYILIDEKGNIYPNARDYFLKNYIQVAEDTYESIPVVYEAWCIGEDMTEQVKSIIEADKLIIHEDQKDRYFEGRVSWGTLYAKKDAIILFYNAKLGVDCDFNFVAKDIFDLSYKVLS